VQERLAELLESLKEQEEWEMERREPGLEVYRRAGGIFLVVHVGSDPVRFDVGVGKELARLLTEKYESIMSSRVMDAATWVEVICVSQLDSDELLDLVRASFARAG
jgi:predicted DNA-binding protein (MmcQ/YjbR family)